MDFISAADDPTTAGLSYTASTRARARPHRQPAAPTPPPPLSAGQPRVHRSCHGAAAIVRRPDHPGHPARTTGSRRRSPCRTGSATGGGFTYNTDAASATEPTTWSGSSPRATAAAPATASSSPPRWRSWRRELGIPARVAVGFLAPTRPGPTPTSSAPTTCTPGPSCTSPASAGCAFEPTPAGGADAVATDAPGYTTALPVNIGNETTAPSDRASAATPDSRAIQRSAADGGRQREGQDLLRRGRLPLGVAGRRRAC